MVGNYGKLFETLNILLFLPQWLLILFYLVKLMISFCKEKCHFQVVFYVIFAFTIHACSTKLSIENALRVVTKLFQFRENCTIASVRPIIINKNAMHYFVYQIRGHKNKIKIFWIWLTLN